MATVLDLFRATERGAFDREIAEELGHDLEAVVRPALQILRGFRIVEYVGTPQGRSGYWDWTVMKPEGEALDILREREIDPLLHLEDLVARHAGRISR